jgi:hypothetical protein
MLSTVVQHAEHDESMLTLGFLVYAAVLAAMEPILQSVLGMRPMRDPELLSMQARSLEALAGCLAARPASVPPVLQKVIAVASLQAFSRTMAAPRVEQSKACNRWHLTLHLLHPDIVQTE